MVIPQALYTITWEWPKKSSILFFTRGRLGVKLLDVEIGQFEGINDRDGLVRKELDSWERFFLAPPRSSIMIQIHAGS